MNKLVDISGLNIRFTGERTVYAVNDLSLSLKRTARCSGLLGESAPARASLAGADAGCCEEADARFRAASRCWGANVLALDDEELSASAARPSR